MSGEAAVKPEADVPTAARSTILAHPNGLHARPAIRLTKLAKRFASSIGIARAPDGPWVDAKSVAKVMAMKTPGNVTLYFRATGGDAGAAVDALIELVATDFADDGLERDPA